MGALLTASVDVQAGSKTARPVKVLGWGRDLVRHHCPFSIENQAKARRQRFCPRQSGGVFRRLGLAH